MQLFAKSSEEGTQLKELLKTVKHEIELDKWENSHHLNMELSPKEKEAITNLKSKGYHLIPGFTSREQCEKIIADIDGLHEKFEDRVQVSPGGEDHRLFGSNHHSELIHEFYTHPLIHRVTSYFEKTEDYKGFTMAAHLNYTEGNKGSGQGWHRDRADRRQIKVILYLTDVTEETGPFQYFEGSHTPESVLHGVLDHGFQYNQNRFSDEEIEPLDKSKLVTATAKAGTLLIADTRGIHRGAPIHKGERYVLMNYTWPHSIPGHIKKMVV